MAWLTSKRKYEKTIEDDGRINIDFELHDDIVYCSISDNGIGRINAAKLDKEDNGFEKKSLGIELTHHRLQLFESSLHGDDAMIVIKDITNEAGQNAGTCVHIKIPVKST